MESEWAKRKGKFLLYITIYIIFYKLMMCQKESERVLFSYLVDEILIQSNLVTSFIEKKNVKHPSPKSRIDPAFGNKTRRRAAGLGIKILSPLHWWFLRAGWEGFFKYNFNWKYKKEEEIWTWTMLLSQWSRTEANPLSPSPSIVFRKIVRYGFSCTLFFYFHLFITKLINFKR